ncbi:MAG: ribosomal protein S18-alanine N-acetyltransferase [Chloroflexi bacterium]|nr:ribosomal protein S18-alanine N-acetyltransferase [Chloroflexota bacterium]
MNQLLPYTIRPMEPGDIPTVTAIEKLSYPTPWSASSYLYELSHNTRSSYYVLLKPQTGESAPSERGWRRWLRSVLGLPNKSRVIGYVGFRLQPAEMHISTIAVHPDWRRKGLGELLLLTAMEQALELEARIISLEARASNQVAQNMYHKYGFRFKCVHPGYYRDGEDAWLMETEVSGDAYRTQLAGLCQALEARLLRQRADVGQKDGDTI